MAKFEINDKVDVLDGTGLFGRIVDKAYGALNGELVATYKVACPEMGSKWYNEDELAAPSPAVEQQRDIAVEKDWQRDNETGAWLHGYGEPEPVADGAGGDAADHAVQMARTLDDLAGDFVRFRMMLAQTLGLHDNELLDESNDEICERVATLEAELRETRARLAAVEAALKPFAFCPIHPSWDDNTRVVILMNWRQPGLEVSINEGLKLVDVRRAVALLKSADVAGDVGASGAVQA